MSDMILGPRNKSVCKTDGNACSCAVYISIREIRTKYIGKEHSRLIVNARCGEN